MSILRTLLLLPALALVGSLAAVISANANPGEFPNNPPRTIIIGIDLSTSNPLVRDDGFAARVAERIHPMIANLAPRSRVMLRSFGAYNSQANSALTLDIVIAPKLHPAPATADFLRTVIAAVPQMVRQGRVQTQNATNIVPFLMNIAKVVDCRAMPTQVILASDGVEDSQVTNLARRSATLPAPASAPFPGCEELAILGIGRGLNSPGDTERLRGEWAFWAQAAGFQHFSGLNDW